MAYSRADLSSSDRAGAVIAVVAVHALLAALLLAQHSTATRAGEAPALTLVTIAPPPPPPPPPPAPVKPAREAAGAPAPKAIPTEIVAPPPRLIVRAKPPIVAAPVAAQGSAVTSGAALAGSGTGAGGSGNGRGAGGDGGGGSKAVWLVGGLRNSDYPRDLLDQRVGGTARVRFTVQPSGRIAACRIASSTGSGLLDDLTCRLLTERLRFRPATDAGGRAIPSEVGTDYTWGVRQRF